MMSERRMAYASLVPGIILSVALTPKDGLFLANFLFYLLSQWAVLAVVCLIRPRAGTMAGCALVLFAYQGMYMAWWTSQTHVDPLAILGYVFSLPGALVGGICGGLWVARRPYLSFGRALGWTAAAVSAGLAIAQGTICATVMYCGI